MKSVRTDGLNFRRLFLLVSSYQQRLNKPAVNVVQCRHYSFSLIRYAKSKTRFSTGKQRNVVWKCILDAECSRNIIARQLATLINLSGQKVHFLSKLKYAKIIPVYKDGDESEPCYYRPTSLLESNI